MDGRGDLHSQGPGMRDYLLVRDLKPGWRETLARWDVRYAVVAPDHGLVVALQEDGWSPLLEGEPYTVLERPTR
jgi:hypothetical protein